MKVFTLLCTTALFIITGCSPKNNEQNDAVENQVVTDTVVSSLPASTAEPAKTSAETPFDLTGKDTVKLSSGLMYIMVEKGTGPKAENGKYVSVNYTGYFLDGNIFDSSKNAGHPYRFKLGNREVIAGWDLGILQLTMGSKARLIVPPGLGYGEEGYAPVIPPNATLVFDLELVSVE